MLLGKLADTKEAVVVENMALQNEEIPLVESPDMRKRRLARLQRWHERLLCGWALHFIITLLVIFCGIYANGGNS